MAIYGKKENQNIFFIRTKMPGAYDLETGYAAKRTYSNDDLWVDLELFYGKVKFGLLLKLAIISDSDFL